MKIDRVAWQILLNEAMLVERTRYLQAAPYERVETRQDYANGFKPKQLKVQLGKLSLNVPQVRQGGCVQNSAVLIAFGVVDEDGRRKVLGV